MLKRLSLTEEFRAWLDTKSGPYNYEHCLECALAQFLKHKHGPDAKVVVNAFHYEVNGESEVIPAPLHAQLRTGNFDRLRQLIDTDALF